MPRPREVSVTSSETGHIFHDPLVADFGDERRSLAANVTVQNGLLKYNEGRQLRQLPVHEEEPVTVADDRLSATVRLPNDLSVTLRRITDEDGTWASKIESQAPADSLEQLALGRPYMSQAPYVDDSESVWAALDANTEELKELVYSSPTGMYARSDLGWFKFPEDDLSLDGLEAIDVKPDFIDVFDQAEQDGRKIERSEVLEYEDKSDTEEPAEDTEPETEPESEGT